MHFTVSTDDPTYPDRRTDGPVDVGWLLSAQMGSVIFDPPRRVRTVVSDNTPAKSAARCPAILNLESRYFEVPCPYDLSLGFQRDENGTPEIVNLLGDKSPVRMGALADLIEMTPENEWRHTGLPIFQIKLPYIFLADEPVFLSQVPPFAHFRSEPLPGLMIGGRFPVHVWPRPLMWAFEWHDPDTPLNLKRGEPLFYVQFETNPQERAVRLVEAQNTSELSAYLDLISGVVNYVNQTFSLFEAAEARRPAKLLTPVDRAG